MIRTTKQLQGINISSFQPGCHASTSELSCQEKEAIKLQLQTEKGFLHPKLVVHAWILKKPLKFF